VGLHPDGGKNFRRCAAQLGIEVGGLGFSQLDAVRCCKLALDNGLSGALTAPSSYFKKSPPIQYTDEEARRLTEEFIDQYGKKKSKPSTLKLARGKLRAVAQK
jgi:hypothetical protein